MDAIKKAKNYMLRSCGKGNTCACKKAKRIFASERMSLSAGATFVIADAFTGGEHVNKLPFSGVLLIVDAPSTKPPHGSRGHRIYVPKAVAAKRLNGLIGMAVNYDSEDLDSHETRHKVGVITEASMHGNQVLVKGFVWKKDFPEAVRDLKRGGLGMSMELANVYVRDEHEDVWHLEDFEFTGATILKKSAAAYFDTRLVASAMKTAMTASAAAVSGKFKKGASMDKGKKNERRVAAAGDGGQGALLVSAIKGAISDAMNPVVDQLKASNDRTDRLSNDLEELKGLYMIQAAAHEDDEDDDEEMSASRKREEDEEDDDEEMSASRKQKEDDDEEEEDDDDEEMSASRRHEDDEEEDDEEDMDAMEDLEKEAVSEEPGDLNKGARNLGNKTTVTDPPNQREKVSGNIAKGRLKSAGRRGKRPFPGLKSSVSMQAAAVEISSLHAQLSKTRRINSRMIAEMKAERQKFKKEIRKVRNQYAALEAQAERWADQVQRRSVIPVEIRNLAAKAQVDLHELKAEGRKLSVADVDRMFAVAQQQGIQVDTAMRAAYKSHMYQLGLMDGGEIPVGESVN